MIILGSTFEVESCELDVGKTNEDSVVFNCVIIEHLSNPGWVGRNRVDVVCVKNNEFYVLFKSKQHKCELTDDEMNLFKKEVDEHLFKEEDQ